MENYTQPDYSIHPDEQPQEPSALIQLGARIRALELDLVAARASVLGMEDRAGKRAHRDAPLLKRELKDDPLKWLDPRVRKARLLAQASHHMTTYRLRLARESVGRLIAQIADLKAQAAALRASQYL